MTASAGERCESEILEIIDAEDAWLVQPTSFVVLPRCLVTVRWHPRMTIAREPPLEVLPKIFAPIGHEEVVAFGSSEKLRNDAMSSALSDEPDEAKEPDLQLANARFLELHAGSTRFHDDIGSMLMYEGEMLFVLDLEAEKRLKRKCDRCLGELDELRTHMRASLNAISSINAARLLEIAKRQQAAATAQQEAARLQQKATNKLQEVATDRQNRVAFLTAMIAPAALVASVFGANVKLLGSDTWIGTAVIAILIAVGTLGAYRVFIRTRIENPPAALDAGEPREMSDRRGVRPVIARRRGALSGRAARPRRSRSRWR